MEDEMHASDRIGRRMKLRDLHVLMAVVQAGNMSRAASVLNTTQSAVSRCIAELEEIFGVRLLDRSRQGVSATEYGRAVLDGSAVVFDELRQTIKNVEFLHDPTAGEIRVGSSDPINIGLLLEAIYQLRKKHSGISVHIMPVAPSGQQFQDLRDRKIDLLLGRILSQYDEDIRAETLFQDHCVIAAGSRSKWAWQRKIKLSDLANEPWALPRVDTIIGPSISKAFHERGVKFPPRSAVWGPPSVTRDLVARGPFLGVFSASVLKFGSTSPRLKVLPVDLPVTPWPIGIMTLKKRTLTPVAQFFIDFTREIVKPLMSER
jgi:DNA-binding transcriptional LysR family regulator